MVMGRECCEWIERRRTGRRDGEQKDDGGDDERGWREGMDGWMD